MKNSQSVTSLNFTGCELGPAGTEILAKVVKVCTVKDQCWEGSGEVKDKCYNNVCLMRLRRQSLKNIFSWVQSIEFAHMAVASTVMVVLACAALQSKPHVSIVEGFLQGNRLVELML